MFIRVQPLGMMPPSPEDRMPLWRVVSGDDWTLQTKVSVGGCGATRENSRLTFTLSQDRFSVTPLWTGAWDTGIKSVDEDAHPGLVTVHIPSEVADTLRRGAYAFSLTVADRFGDNVTTAVAGTLQVEYEPGSPQHDIPYRHNQPLTGHIGAVT